MRAALQAVKREIERLPVMRRQQQITDFAAGESLGQQIAHREIIAERFAHLFAFDQQMRPVQPILDKRLAGACKPAPSLWAISSS